MTWQQALHWAIDNPGELVYDKDGNAHLVSMDSGSPNLRVSEWKARPFDPDCEPYKIVSPSLSSVR